MVSKITDSNGVQHSVRDDRVQTATSENIGMVKPDGDTTTIDADGTLHASGNPFKTDAQGFISFTY